MLGVCCRHSNYEYKVIFTHEFVGTKFFLNDSRVICRNNLDESKLINESELLTNQYIIQKAAISNLYSDYLVICRNSNDGIEVGKWKGSSEVAAIR